MADREAKKIKLRARTLEELKEMCARRGVRKSGLKAELVARLCNALCREEAEREAKIIELRARTLEELKEMCARRGLRKSGLKAELVARLSNALCSDQPAAKRPRTEAGVRTGRGP